METKLIALSLQLLGEIHHSDFMKALYATDASVYRELPLAVALPKNVDDIKKLVAFATDNQTSLIPRTAGTSLAGQCVGDGIVVDTSKYMNQILEVNKEEQWVRVQPGVIRDELNEYLESYGLFFGPNTSTSNRCMIGGMVGNNSCGSTSIVYGSTRDHVLELKTILSDGSEALFSNTLIDSFQSNNQLEQKIYNQILKELSKPEVKNEILEGFPKKTVTRRNTGYAVDALLDMIPFDEKGKPFNICKMLAGSEGTLAFTTEIKLNLVPLPKKFDVVIAAHFNSVRESLEATVIAMQHSPTACELMDKTILDCTKENISQAKNRFFIDGDPKAILMIEFRDDTLTEAQRQAQELIESFKLKNIGYSFPIIKGEQTNSVWDLRKAGLGLLANIPGDKKAVACIEDTAVDVQELPKYIDEFSEMMKGFEQEAVYYAHAGAGELHLRPILNLKDENDVKRFREISLASANLVKKYKGSLSGEHGDGRVRSEFIPLVVGEKNYELFKRIKQTWDPQNIFNPGKIVNAPAMNKSLRYASDVETPEINTIFNFETTGGILRNVEKCNGSGDCRKLNFTGGTMCPSYRATKDEKDSTRGRANILREFLTQNTKENPFNHPEINTAMDLCLSCKGCKSECPSNIDMATLKSEFLFQYQKSNGVSWRTKLLVNNNRLNKIASLFPRVHNMLAKTDWFKKMLGVAKKRSIPELHSETLRSWFKKQNQNTFDQKVYLFCDEITNFYDVDLGKKTILLLNSLGYEVLIVSHPESARAFISKGFLKEAKKIATKNVQLFSRLISKETPLIGIEPSAILGFRDEYPNLVDSEDKNKALDVSSNVFTIDEFLSNEIDRGAINSSMFTTKEKHIVVHSHCHQKVLSSQTFTEKYLSLPSNYHVETLNTGCCGMAGTFGYEKVHYELSMKIGEMVLFPELIKRNKVSIAATGSSCRHQIKDGIGREVVHPIVILYDAILNKL